MSVEAQAVVLAVPILGGGLHLSQDAESLRFQEFIPEQTVDHASRSVWSSSELDDQSMNGLEPVRSPRVRVTGVPKPCVAVKVLGEIGRAVITTVAVLQSLLGVTVKPVTPRITS